MECYLSFSVKEEEMTICCLGIASCLSSQTHLKKKKPYYLLWLLTEQK